MLMRRLERLGYSVSCAENGVEALKLLRTESFDVLLLDIVMPGMDGFEVLEQLKLNRCFETFLLSCSQRLISLITL